ncbi:MAG: non-ribosomal peptide synthetase [Acidimicrobiales bacterium]
MSFAQERLWFLDRLSPSTATYNIPMAFHLVGVTDTRFVIDALDDLVTRHEVLRTTFEEVDGVPVQVVHDAPNVRVDLRDVRHLDRSDQRVAAFAFAVEDAQRPFDLMRGPVLRATLVLMADREAVLVLTVHHIAADLWSTTILARDFDAAYAARRGSGPVNLPELTIQYADFAEWQRTQMDGTVLDALVDYWTSQLAGAAAEVTFPHDRPRQHTQTLRGETVLFEIPPHVSEVLVSLSREEGATLFMTLLAAFNVLLGRYAATDDVVVGTPIANRRRPEVENLIGFFSNTLVLRSDVGGNPTFREMIGRTRAVALGAYEHQDLPFEQLVAARSPQRNQSVPAIFQVLFGLQTTGSASREEQDSAGWGEISTGTAKFDATVLIRETHLGLQGGFEYATDLYDRPTVDQIIGGFSAFLEAASQDPDRPIAELAGLAFGGYRGDLVGSPAPPVVMPRTTVVELFTDQASRARDVTAVVGPGGRLTYGDVDVESNRIASLLRARGVGRGDRVGVCLGSSVRAPVAVLGVLRSGAAYVPLDPRYPTARLAYMCRDARLSVVLTDPSAAPVLPVAVAPIVDVQDLSSCPSACGGVVSEIGPLGADDLAYVIYTSGSTGHPKGVAVPHATLANLTSWQVASSARELRTLQLAPISFDVSLQEVFATWCSGGTLVIADEGLRSDPRALLAQLRDERIERIFLPPALLQLAAEVVAPDEWPMSLREIVTAGEALRITPSVRAAFARLDRSTMIRNQYGPSETHVVTEHQFSVADTNVADLPPIGRQITNASLYVLDGLMNPVPPGARGELYIGGVVLARGYLGRPDQTAERFCPDRFASEPGARMYRTGDLVRWNPDDGLVFVGRVDDQLKIRGYRVEPGEVEVELERLEGVKAAVVVGHTNGPDVPKELVAFVQADGDLTLDEHDLRQKLRSRLPQWMIPERFASVDGFPLTPSGKVDRRSLAERDLPRPEGAAGVVAPRSDLEQELSEIWSDVLGVDSMGVNESFFDLGGHSLAVARVAARVRERMGVELPLRVMFDAVDIEGLAREIVFVRAMEADPGVVEELLSRPEGVDDQRSTVDPEQGREACQTASLS